MRRFIARLLADRNPPIEYDNSRYLRTLGGGWRYFREIVLPAYRD